MRDNTGTQLSYFSEPQFFGRGQSFGSRLVGTMASSLEFAHDELYTENEAERRTHDI